MFILGNFLRAVAIVLNYLLTFYMWIVIAQAVLSWVNPDPYNPIVRFIYNVTEPVLNQIRRADLSTPAGVHLIQELPDVEAGRVRHDDRPDGRRRIYTHHGVKTSATAFLIKKANAIDRPDVPSEGHRDGHTLVYALGGVEQPPGHVAEDRRMRAKLILKKLPESFCRSNQSAECRPVNIVVVESQPSALIATDQLAAHHQAFDEIHKRILLQITLRVVLEIRHYISEFLGRDPQALENVVPNE